MKRIVIFLICLACIISVTGLCACSKLMSLSSEKKALLGSWDSTNNTKIQGNKLTFNEDGTCIKESYWNFEDIHEKGTETLKGTWSYEEKTKTLTYVVSGSDYKENYCGIVLSITDKYFTVIDLGGNSETWTKN